ncbi:TorF family putative porin [Roseateles koreensis]|uniref:TorF family putative porin n=1 Tax=Roseateles koreensis TaxID=2987526 RepID=A0ABT5KQA0_9BURK|nr:TorF family putative porin [Roseateles koreensis]MDC8784645.1 TorF family putative porin [Roseateles koreensis]
MKTKPTLILIAAATLLTGTARAADTTPEHTLTGNLGLSSDYRFRGISQTYKLPAIQGGLDDIHSSGAYLGTWLSNVSGNSYNNGAGLEVDLYGGYKFALSQDMTLDLGALAYVYPGARLNSAPGVATNEKYTSVDLYADLSVGPFSAKLSIAASDYFGLNSQTSGYAYFSSLPARGGSKGSAYLDLNYNIDLGDGLTLGTHLGHLAVKHYDELSYSDFKLALSKETHGLTLTGALVGTNAKRDFYQVANAAGQNAKRVGDTGLVLCIRKTF